MSESQDRPRGGACDGAADRLALPERLMIALPISDDVPRTLEQVAEILGAPYSVHTLRAAADRGELITYRVVGNAAFTDRRFLQQWIEQCRARAANSGAATPGGAEVDPSPATSQRSEDVARTASADAAAVAQRLTAGRSAKVAKNSPRPRGRKLHPVS